MRLNALHIETEEDFDLTIKPLYTKSVSEVFFLFSGVNSDIKAHD